MDPFKTLPVPILEAILKLLPNLTTLYSLRNASPTVASLLHERHVASPLIEILMSQSLPLIRSFIRVIILLRWSESESETKSETKESNNLLPSSYEALIEPYNQHNQEVLGGRPILSDYSAAPLPKSIPPPIICHVLGLTTYVHQLTHAFIHEMIARCMALKPMHLKNPKFKYRRRPTSENRQPRPPGQPYQPVDCGPPSWVEEQRVARAIWRIAFYFELQHVVVERGLLGWKKEDVERLRNLSAEKFWDRLVIGVGVEKEEIKAVLDWMYPDCSAARKQLPPWVNPVLHLSGNRVYCCPDPTPTTEADWKIARKNLASFSSPGFAFGKQAIANLDSSPLKRVDFAVFRPRGFAIWDLKRMIDLGFLEDFYSSRDKSAESPPLSESNLFFTWESILTRTQSEEVESKQKEQWHIS